MIAEEKFFIQEWGSGHLACDLAAKLTCPEVEALAGMLQSMGALDAASVWLEQHAAGDEPGDMHYRDPGDTA